MGDKLFDALMSARPEIAAIVDAEIVRVFRETNRFEEGMGRVWGDGSRRVAPFLRAMAKYLASFEPCACKRYGYRRLLAALTRNLRRTQFATLNYDLLLDRTALQMGLGIRFGDELTKGTAAILKPHGSVNFLPAHRIHARDLQIVGCSTYIETNACVVPPPFDLRDIERWCDDPDNEAFAPAMSVYAIGKATPYNSGLVTEYRDAWATAARTAKRVVIVGVKVTEEDTHLWSPLADNRGAIMYVNPSSGDRQAFADWSARHRGRSPVECVPHGFAESIDTIARRLAVH
ncbi:hypothetical protein [Lysobacter sp. HA35]